MTFVHLSMCVERGGLRTGVSRYESTDCPPDLLNQSWKGSGQTNMKTQKALKKWSLLFENKWR